MDDTYDVIVLGTGLKECILSGLMSIDSKKVLHLDRNSYYGGESASLNLDQLYKRFRGDETPPKELGSSREYCVDLCPKFLMACGNLVKILLKTKVTAYLEFRSVAGSYVYQAKKKGILKVPSTPKEALGSSLLQNFQKVRYKQFITFVGDYDQTDPKTHKKHDIPNMNSTELYKAFKLTESAWTFTGHAVALYRDDSYLTSPAMDLIERCQLYANSVARYGNSPYIYPKWGLGGLPEGFSRRCAVQGGVYMLNSDETKGFIENIEYDDEGKAVGVTVGGETAKTSLVIGDPSYWAGTDKVKETGKIARAICILTHPIDDTNNADSCQIILPADDVERKSDIYVCMSSYQHNVASQDHYIAVCSANIESDPPAPEDDLEPAFKLMGEIAEKFVWISDTFEPVNDPSKDGCHITSSYDATTHFESSSSEVLAMYEAITGTALDLTPEALGSDEGDQ